MNAYTVSNDFFEIITGTTNKLHPVYIEAAKDMDTGNTKALSYIKNFITSIERVANKSKVKDERISSTKGNINNLSVYDSIKTSMDFLRKNLGGNKTVKGLSDIFDALDTYKSQYIEGYEKNVRLVVLEYESAVDILITGLSLCIAEGIEIVKTGNTMKIKPVKKESNGIINKTIIDLAKELKDKNHKKYLEEILKARDSVKVDTNIKESTTFTEAGIGDTLEMIEALFTSIGKIGSYSINIIKALKRSLFGIVPLIRSCLYIHYKKKADTVLSLEQQAEFIKQNIEQLQNRTNMDPAEKEAIIKKQQATIEAYQKKAAKLRAQLIDTEREASNAINAENPNMKNADDEFILENGKTVQEYFNGDE